MGKCWQVGSGSLVLPKCSHWVAFSQQRSQATPGSRVALSLFPSTLGKQMAGRLWAACWYLEEDPPLAGLLAKSLLSPASGKALTLTWHAGNEMGVGSCETQIIWATWCLWNWEPFLCFVLYPPSPLSPALLAQHDPGWCCSCIEGQCQLFPHESWVTACTWVRGVFTAWISNGSSLQNCCLMALICCFLILSHLLGGISHV